MKTWFITGASRGLGLETARAALAVGDQVVATARDPQQIDLDGGRVLRLALDVTDTAAVDAAVAAATRRFGRIDVLVNNAGYGQLGHFEQVSAGAIERQFATNVFGVFDVTRAVLPIMRAQRSGHVITISSISGLIGFDGSSIYSATKFAVTGWSASLSLELERFGIKATVVHPGRFRTDFLDRSSVGHADLALDDYADIAAANEAELDAGNHAQTGDPVAFGRLLVTLANSERPPTQLPAASEAVRVLEGRLAEIQEVLDTWGERAAATDFVAGTV